LNKEALKRVLKNREKEEILMTTNTKKNDQYIMKRYIFRFLFFSILVLPVYTTAAESTKAVVTGQLKTWHRITLTFECRPTSETAEDNPFLNCRLDVIFENGTEKFTVPGFYAADGNAADTGEASGSKYRAYFVPDKSGTWNYAAYFSTGDDVAIKPFQPTQPFTSGSFYISPTDKYPPDLRARGMLRYVGRRYLQFAQTKDFFLKAGADSPENFLAYHEFDATYDTNDGQVLENGFLHKYTRHIDDFRDGDPTWSSGKGVGIIGALNYLASKGVNSVYFIPYNIDGGDGKDTWPWIDHNNRLRYDCSKLDQWEIVFSHMDKLGLMMHIILQEEENSQGLDKGRLGQQRKLYYRELIARFSHHLALIWNLGEESTNTTAQQKEFAEYIRSLDPYDHPIVLHTFPNNQEKVYTPLLGFQCLEGASLQTLNAHQQTLLWTSRSAEYAKPWVVCLDEIADAEVGVKPDSDDYWHDEPRKKFLWANLMAGGAGVEWYFGYEYPHNDLNCEDFRSRAHMWEMTHLAVSFFHNYLPFTKMSPADELTSNENDYCFALPSKVYAVYLPEGGTTALDLEQNTETFDIKWYNPRAGGELRDGTAKFIHGPGKQSIGLPPYDKNKDWLALIRLYTIQ
jgi:hypothetical protein